MSLQLFDNALPRGMVLYFLMRHGRMVAISERVGT